jgi:hypothetical protein
LLPLEKQPNANSTFSKVANVFSSWAASTKDGGKRQKGDIER